MSGIAATARLLLVRFGSDDLGGWDTLLVCQMKGCQFKICLDNYLGQVSKGVLSCARTVVHKDLSALKVGLKWYKLAQNKQAWRQLIATVRT